MGSSRVQNQTTCPPFALPGLHCNTERIARRPCVRGCAQPYTFKFVGLAEDGTGALVEGEDVLVGEEDRAGDGEPVNWLGENTVERGARKLGAPCRFISRSNARPRES